MVAVQYKRYERQTANPSRRGRAHQQRSRAAFIASAAMVGAGIFSLLGAAGEVAGARRCGCRSSLAGGLAGAPGLLVRESSARRYPSAGGLLEYVNRGFGEGSYADGCRLAGVHRQRHRDGDGRLSHSEATPARPLREMSPVAVKVFAVALLGAMTALNLGGSRRW